MSELKPCPFCGGEAEIKRVGNNCTKKRAVHIDCSTIGCSVQIRVAAITQNHEWCEQKASERWNTRVPTEAEDRIKELQAQLEGLTDFLSREGYRRCDSPACNCDSYHAVTGWIERFREAEATIKELKPYLKHRNDAEMHCDALKHSNYKCNCGLAALLKETNGEKS